LFGGRRVGRVHTSRSYGPRGVAFGHQRASQPSVRVFYPSVRVISRGPTWMVMIGGGDARGLPAAQHQLQHHHARLSHHNAP
jgi:hypothetical protein